MKSRRIKGIIRADEGKNMPKKQRSGRWCGDEGKEDEPNKNRSQTGPTKLIEITSHVIRKNPIMIKGFTVRFH